MRMIEVRSDREVSPGELKKIQDIFLESQCPNESLLNSIDGCKGFRDGVVTIGNGEGFTAHVEV